MDIVIVGILMFLTLVGAGLAARHVEKKAFNGGFCPSCGRKWRRYDMDSQGGRGYTCDSCNKGVWVSYRSVDKDFVNG